MFLGARGVLANGWATVTVAQGAEMGRPSRLEVLASEQDPAVSEAFSEDDYRRTVTLLHGVAA